ncbi:MAG: CRISPR-associated protein Cse3 family [Chlorobi bacterium]|nr:CRISPR-associated protein Cse3 family [Chlorobiota bacterium]
MYLSELQLNPRSRDARRDLAAPYEMHRTLKRAFPDGEPEGNRLLFRMEPPRTEEGGGLRVLVQSSIASPDWSLLPEGYFHQVRGPRPLRPEIPAGTILSFRLHANPTVKRAGKRQGLMDEEEYLAWLSRKGLEGGFEVLFAHAAKYRLGDFHSTPTHERKTTIPHFGVRFEGMLQVSNADEFLKTLSAGVGSAKSFGFGLLTVARPG